MGEDGGRGDFREGARPDRVLTGMFPVVAFRAIVSSWGGGEWSSLALAKNWFGNDLGGDGGGEEGKVCVEIVGE